MDWSKIAYFLLALFLVWLLYRFIRNNPGALSKANFAKSARTLGFLALFLIALIAFAVLLTR